MRGSLDNIPENTHNLDRKTISNSPAAIEHTHTARKDSSSSSSIPPLASLEYLQSQRRGSITDPSLHAHANPHSGHSSNASRPTSPYMSHPHTHSINGHHILQGRKEALSPSQLHPQADVPTGSKRKMSSDRSALARRNEEIDPQLAGPGVVGDQEAPPAKRRVSSMHRLDEERERRERHRRGSSGGASGDSSAIAGSPRVNGMEFAWPPHTHHLPDMQNEAHRDSNINQPVDPNNLYPHQSSMMSSIAFQSDRQDDLSQGEPSSGPVRSLRSRSRPPSRQIRRGDDPISVSSTRDNTEDPSHEASPDGLKSSRDGATPYSRSPELRVSHKLAERKRRKEMKDLFDELREQLPADRGMKASKWEILSKAIDFVAQLKQSHQEMAIELDRLRHEMDGVRGGVPPPYGPGGPAHNIYGQGSLVSHSFPPAPPAHQLSRPPSSQSAHFPPGAGPAHQAPLTSKKGSPDGHRAEGS